MTQDIHSLYIFDGCSKEEVDYFLLMTEIREVDENTVILHEWKKSDGTAYFIEKWSVSVERKGMKKGILKVWGFFWEIALITREPRTATVTALEDCILRVFHRDEFKLLMERSKLWKDALKEIMRRIRENTRDDIREI